MQTPIASCGVVSDDTLVDGHRDDVSRAANWVGIPLTSSIDSPYIARPRLRLSCRLPFTGTMTAQGGPLCVRHIFPLSAPRFSSRQPVEPDRNPDRRTRQRLTRAQFPR